MESVRIEKVFVDRPVIVEKPIERIIEKPVIISVAPVEVPPRLSRKPEVPLSTPTKAEEKSSEPKKTEERTSAPEEKSSAAPEPEDGSSKRRKLKKFSGAGGRIHTERQIDEILDFWLQTGELPLYVSERQRRSYRTHIRIPERVKLLEQAGISIVVDVPGAAGQPENVVPLPGKSGQRKTGTSV